LGKPDRFEAIVLAGSRPGGDPVAAHFGVASKAQAPIGGRPMLLRVLDALTDSPSVASVRIVGLPDAALEDKEFAAELDRAGVTREAGAASASASVSAALARTENGRAVLVTTADHALLRATTVESFLDTARASEADILVGVARYPDVDALYPGMRRTVMRLGDGGYCGCNLFAFKSPSGRRATDFWQRVEANRKHPLRIMRMLGPLTLLRYLVGRLTLERALARLSALCGAQIRAAVLATPEAAIDVDKPEDLAVAEALVSRMLAQEDASGFQSSPSVNAP
jgi:CTP:molybdopterin cytidylyltransferase MocA